MLLKHISRVTSHKVSDDGKTAKITVIHDNANLPDPSYEPLLSEMLLMGNTGWHYVSQNCSNHFTVYWRDSFWAAIIVGMLHTYSQRLPHDTILTLDLTKDMSAIQAELDLAENCCITHCCTTQHTHANVQTIIHPITWTTI